MKYQITNITDSILVLEDLGIILPRKGVCTVSEDQFSRSSDVIRNDKWIRIKPIYSITTKTDRSNHNKITTPIPVVSSSRPPPFDSREIPPPPPPQDSEDLRLKVDGIYMMLSRLAEDSPKQMAQLREDIKSMPTPAVIPYRPGMVHAHEISGVGSGEDIPMFIPSKITSDYKESNVSAKKTEAASDVSSNVEALKNLRKPKK